MKLKDSDGNIVTVPKKHRAAIKALMDAEDHDGVTKMLSDIGKIKDDLSHMENVKDFKGPSHEAGGIAYTEDAEVQGNEFAYDFGKEMGEYIFPDPKDSEIGAAARKRVKLREKRKDDRISNDSMKSELSALAQLNELDRFTKGSATQNPSLYAKGGLRRMYAEGGIPMMDPKVPTFDNNILADPQLTPQNVPDSQTEVGTANRYSNASSAMGYATQAAQFAGGITGSTLDTSHQIPESQALSAPMDSVMSAIPVVGQYYQLGNAINTPIKHWQSDARGRGAKGEATAAATMSGMIDPMDGWSQNAQAYEDGVISESEAATNLVAQFFLPGFANNAVAEAYDKKAKSDMLAAGMNKRYSDRSSNMTDSFSYGDRGFGGKNRYASGGYRKKYTDGGPYDVPTEKEWLKLNAWNDPLDEDPVWNGDTSELNRVTDDYIYGMYSTEPEFQGPPVDTNQQRQQYINIGKSIAGGVTNNLGNFALLGKGDSYDSVSYPTMTPELISNELGLRESRDMFGTAMEQAKNSGKLDINTLAVLGSQGSKAASGIRESVNNLNTQTKNAAKQFNIQTTMQGMQDTAANKGTAQSIYYDNLKEIGKNIAGSSLEYNTLENQQRQMGYDEMLKKYLMRTFDSVKYEQ